MDTDALERLTFRQATMMVNHLARHWVQWKEHQHHRTMAYRSDHCHFVVAEQTDTEIEKQVTKAMARFKALSHMRQRYDAHDWQCHVIDAEKSAPRQLGNEVACEVIAYAPRITNARWSEAPTSVAWEIHRAGPEH